MILQSSSIGEIAVADDALLHFPDGLFGFEDLKDFILAEVEEFLPFLWLISVQEPEIGFAVADPRLFHAARYEVLLSDSDKDVLDMETGDSVSAFVIVSISDGGRRITANLKGPVVLNARNRLGKQVVVYSPSYSVRQALLAMESAANEAACIGSRSRAAA